MENKDFELSGQMGSGHFIIPALILIYALVFGFPDDQKILDAVLEGNLEFIKEFPDREKGMYADHISVDFKLCPKCKTFGTYQFNVVRYSDNENGNTGKNAESLCKNKLIDKSGLDLFETYHRDLIRRAATK
ncbi:MAG: hypothetical protein COA79_10440 [Planctomycetota bacterium]|nr:MAG: hypothetical protein COA79_10440 [Planctomycetota bacterium]